jgi:hypothetical protein
MRINVSQASQGVPDLRNNRHGPGFFVVSIRLPGKTTGRQQDISYPRLPHARQESSRPVTLWSCQRDSPGNTGHHSREAGTAPLLLPGSERLFPGYACGLY